MATVTLVEAKSLYHGGVKFVQDKPKYVTDKVAREIEDELPGYFDIRYGDANKPVEEPKKSTGGIKIIKKGGPKRLGRPNVKPTDDSGDVDGDLLPVGSPGRVVTV